MAGAGLLVDFNEAASLALKVGGEHGKLLEKRPLSHGGDHRAEPGGCVVDFKAVEGPRRGREPSYARMRAFYREDLGDPGNDDPEPKRPRSDRSDSPDPA